MPKFVWTKMPEEHEKECTHCQRPLKNECVMLELDQRTDTYHQNCDVPEEHSQGWFPFGKDCAAKLIK